MYLCDISSIYTLIPTELGIEAISYWLYKKQELIPQRFTKEFIIESLKSILKNNNFLFLFDLLGTAMDTKCVPPPFCLAKCWLFRRDKTQLS